MRNVWLTLWVQFLIGLWATMMIACVRNNDGPLHSYLLGSSFSLFLFLIGYVSIKGNKTL